MKTMLKNANIHFHQINSTIHMAHIWMVKMISITMFLNILLYASYVEVLSQKGTVQVES